MKATIRIILTVVVAALVCASCKDDPKFVIRGDMTDGKDITLHLVMHFPDHVVDEVIATRSGHFDYTATAPGGDEVFVEVYSHNYRLLGVGTVSNDSKMTMKIDPEGLAGFSVEGNEFNREFSNFLAEHKKDIGGGDARAVNKAVADYVRNNPGSKVSAVLMTSLYDASDNPAQAATLFGLIKEDARPGYIAGGYADLVGRAAPRDADRVEAVTILSGADTLVRLDPKDYRATLIAFTSDEPMRGDSIKNTLRRLSARAGRRALVVDHFLCGDTLTWKRQLKRDTVTWTSVWSGAGPAAPGAGRFGITSLPYFVVADSTGRTKYRGTSLSAADSVCRRLL